MSANKLLRLYGTISAAREIAQRAATQVIRDEMIGITFNFSTIFVGRVGSIAAVSAGYAVAPIPKKVIRDCLGGQVGFYWRNLMIKSIDHTKMFNSISEKIKAMGVVDGVAIRNAIVRATKGVDDSLWQTVEGRLLEKTKHFSQTIGEAVANATWTEIIKLESELNICNDPRISAIASLLEVDLSSLLPIVRGFYLYSLGEMLTDSPSPFTSDEILSKLKLLAKEHGVGLVFGERVDFDWLSLGNVGGKIALTDLINDYSVPSRAEVMQRLLAHTTNTKADQEGQLLSVSNHVYI